MINVTDHALQRYLERVVEDTSLGDERAHAIRQKLARNPILIAASKAGASNVTIGGFRFALSDGNLLTVVPCSNGRGHWK